MQRNLGCPKKGRCNRKIPQNLLVLRSLVHFSKIVQNLVITHAVCNDSNFLAKYSVHLANHSLKMHGSLVFFHAESPVVRQDLETQPNHVPGFFESIFEVFEIGKLRGNDLIGRQQVLYSFETTLTAI